MANGDAGVMKSDGNEGTGDEARLAEYEALRAESDRIAQLLSNAVWAGVTGFGLTFAGAAAFGGGSAALSLIIPSVALLLCVQALAISTVYASELWKYVRVGTYIRTYIEPYFQERHSASPAPMQWESWIHRHRARALHFASLAFLQAPIGIMFLAGLLLMGVKLSWLCAAEGSSLKFLTYLESDAVLSGLILAICIADVFAMAILARSLRLAEKGDFGDGGQSLKSLQASLRGARPR